MPAVLDPRNLHEDLKREGFHPIDNVSVVLTHLSEVIRNNLPQLLSYKDVKSSSTGWIPNTRSWPTKSARRTCPIPACRRC